MNQSQQPTTDDTDCVIRIQEFHVDGGVKIAVSTTEADDDDKPATWAFLVAQTMIHLFLNGTVDRTMRDLFKIEYEGSIHMESSE